MARLNRKASAAKRVLRRVRVQEELKVHRCIHGTFVGKAWGGHRSACKEDEIISKNGQSHEEPVVKSRKALKEPSRVLPSAQEHESVLEKQEGVGLPEPILELEKRVTDLVTEFDDELERLQSDRNNSLARLAELRNELHTVAAEVAKIDTQLEEVRDRRLAFIRKYQLSLEKTLAKN